jgi:hypothetical protein
MDFLDQQKRSPAAPGKQWKFDTYGSIPAELSAQRPERHVRLGSCSGTNHPFLKASDHACKTCAVKASVRTVKATVRGEVSNHNSADYIQRAVHASIPQHERYGACFGVSAQTVWRMLRCLGTNGMA